VFAAFPPGLADESLQNDAIRPLELAEGLVKCDQLQGPGANESSQISIAGEFGRQCWTVTVRAPIHFDLLRFVNKRDSGIAQNAFIENPPILKRYSLFAERLWIRDEPEKPLLSETLEKERFHEVSFVPLPGCNMVEVNFEGQREPEIDIRKKHPLLRVIPPLSDRSTEGCQVAWSERGEIGLFFRQVSSL